MDRRKLGNKGSTVVEVLIAFCIFSIAVLILYSSMSFSRKITIKAEEVRANRENALSNYYTGEADTEAEVNYTFSYRGEILNDSVDVKINTYTDDESSLSLHDFEEVTP